MEQSTNSETFIALCMDVYRFFRENNFGVSTVTIEALSKYLTLVHKTYILSNLTEYLIKRVMKDIISKDGGVLCQDESSVQANLSKLIPQKMRYLNRYTEDMKSLNLSDSLSEVIDLTLLNHIKELNAGRVVCYYMFTSGARDEYERLKTMKLILGDKVFWEIQKRYDKSNFSMHLLEWVKQGALERENLELEDAITKIIKLLNYFTKQPLGMLGNENAFVRIAYFTSVYCGRFVRESFIFDIINRLEYTLWYHSMESSWGEKFHYLRPYAKISEELLNNSVSKISEEELIDNSVRFILQEIEKDKPEIFKSAIGNPAIFDVLNFCRLLHAETKALQYSIHFATENLIKVEGPFDEETFCNAIYKLVNSWSLTSFLWSFYLERYAYYHPEVNFGADKNEVFEKINIRKVLYEEYKLSSSPNLLKQIEEIDKEYAEPFVIHLKQQLAQYGAMVTSPRNRNSLYHKIKIRIPLSIDQDETKELMLILDRYGFKYNELELFNPSRQIDIGYLDGNFYETKFFLEDHNVIIHGSNMKTQLFDCTLNDETFNVISSKKQWEKDDDGNIHINLKDRLCEVKSY